MRSPDVIEKLRDPVAWSRVTQAVKIVVAAVVAWVLVADVLGLSQSFLAPWSAILVVQATVYRTFSTGVRQVVGAVAGVLIAWAVGTTLGLGALPVAVAVGAGLLVGALPWIGSDLTSAAATALIVLTTGSSTQHVLLVDRLVDTGIGVGVGLLVNLLVWPPLLRRSTVAAIDAIDDQVGDLLVDMAAGLERDEVAAEVHGWIDRTRELDDELDEAWAMVRQARESARMNPRRSARGLRDPREWHRLLVRLEQGVAESRSLARTIALGEDGVGPTFRRQWTAALREAGEAIQAADAERLAAVRETVRGLAAAGASESADHWPVEGAALINLRNITESFALVTEANPLGRPPLPHEALRHLGARPRRRLSA
ncbi:FUSC family protein [Jatrophihabitans fulvus]